MKRKYVLLVVLIVMITASSLIAQKKVSEPYKSYDAFCALFEKNYASFEEKKIDWAVICRKNREKISAETSEEELFDIMKEMLTPLNDGHVSLEAKKLDKKFFATRPSTILKELESLPKKGKKKRIIKMTETTLANNGFGPIKQLGPEFKNERLFSYSKNGKVGYLRFFRSFSKLYAMVGPSLNAQLDQIFNEFQGVDNLIIDIRFNIGGDDKFSQTIAGRFVQEKSVAFYKQTRKNGNFGPLVTKTIRPKGRLPLFDKIVLLTNDRSISAADVFSLIISQLPNATIIGERSNGSYSDLMNAKLPNGWKVTLSNQRYRSADKENFEGLGTPVDIEAKNTLSDIENNNDSVLIEALRFLEEGK